MNRARLVGEADDRRHFIRLTGTAAIGAPVTRYGSLFGKGDRGP